MYQFLAKAAAAGESTYKFEGREKIEVGGHREYSKRQALIFNPGEIYSVKVTSRGPTAGRYVIKLASMPHVTFRSVPPEAVKEVIDASTPVDAKVERAAAGRAAYTSTRSSKADKQKDDLYKPAGTINERTTYDRNNYQWRLVVASKINVKTLKYGRMRATINKNDVVGLRYSTKAKGGYVILPDDQRINISHENYLEIVEGSRILAPARQQKGLVVIAEIKTGPKDRILYRDEDGKVIRGNTKTKPNNPVNTVKGLLRDAKKAADVDMGEWDDEDADISKTVAERMQRAKQPAQHKPTQLKVGSTIRAGRSVDSTFIVANIEDLGKVNEYALYNVTSKKVAMLKLDKNKDMSKEADYALLEDADKRDVAAAIRAFNKYVQQREKEKKPVGRRR